MAIHADTKDLDRLALAFKAAPKEIKSAHRKRLKSAVKPTVDDAKRRIEPYSPRVAATIRSGARGANKVVIQSGNKGMPIARLLEKNTFRHPFFGDRDRWYEQEGHPYMHPAWNATRDAVVDDISEAVHQAMRDVGIDGRLARAKRSIRRARE